MVGARDGRFARATSGSLAWLLRRQRTRAASCPVKTAVGGFVMPPSQRKRRQACLQEGSIN